MIGASTNLPKEVVALVHHVELNSAGWWERTIQRLIMAAVWMSGKPLTKDEIAAYMRDQFKLELSGPKLDSALSHLENESLLLRLPAGAYRIPDSQQEKLDKEVAEAEAVAGGARDYFVSVLTEQGIALDPNEVWACFEKHFLIPLVNEIGDNSRKFLSGEPFSTRGEFVLAFLQCFKTDVHDKLRQLVTTFLNPERKDVRAYMGRMLHARFCVEAGGMSEATVKKLAGARSKQLRFRVFVDTNFLFSLLQLHENPANDAAAEVKAIISKLQSNPQVELVVAPRTITEAKTALDASRIQLKGIAVGKHFNRAMLTMRVSGIIKKYFIEQGKRGGLMTADEWFNPYLNNFVPLARAKGVELYNDPMEEYSMDQGVIDDIAMVTKYEENLPEWKRKTYEKLAHDIILWHFVNRQRGKKGYIESPMDAEDWILTLDGRLIGFDEMKHRKADSTVPSCIHPTTMVQMLQFWIPRSQEFEEAMLSSLRLPFLYQEFDGSAEKTTLKILRAMGRFHLGDDVTEEAITNVLVNEELRKRLQMPHPEEEEATLVRDVLIEEMRSELSAEKERADKAEAEAQAHAKDKATIMGQLDSVKDRAIAETRLEMQETMERLEKERNEEHGKQLEAAHGKAELESIRAGAAETKLQQQGETIAGMKSQLDRLTRESAERKALLDYLGLLALVVGGACGGAWYGRLLMPDAVEVFGTQLVQVILAIALFVLGHLILEFAVRKNLVITSLWPFRQLKRFRAWIWSFVAVNILMAVAVELYSNHVQNELDHKNYAPVVQPATPQAPEKLPATRP